jgi:hypothetical protein
MRPDTEARCLAFQRFNDLVVGHPALAWNEFPAAGMGAASDRQQGRGQEQKQTKF